MAPPAARPAFCAISGALRARTSTAARRTVKPSSRLLPHTPRSLSTTISKDASADARPAAVANPVDVPPESPYYILIPTPPQNSESKPAPIKGHLPVPRDIFAKRAGGGPDKGPHATAYVEAVLPRSAAEQAGHAPRSEAEARKRAETDMRRRNLETSLQGLWVRREATAQKTADRLARRAAENRAAAVAPDRDDDVFTRPTVRASTRQTAVPLDPLRFERTEEARARTAALAARKSEARKDALAHLYMAAGAFIVDEAELERRVESEFGEEKSNAVKQIYGEYSLWDTWDAPPTVASLIRDMEGKSFSAVISRQDDHSRTLKRQQIVSEQLTGGKLN